MSTTLERLMQIQGAASEERQSATKCDNISLLDLKRAILEELAKGATTKAVTLCLQGIGKGDSDFMEEAARLMQPAPSGEVWRLAFRAYERHRASLTQAIGAEAQQEKEEAAYKAIGMSCSDIYNIGTPLARCLSFAVCEALSAEQEQRKREIAKTLSNLAPETR